MPEKTTSEEKKTTRSGSDKLPRPTSRKKAPAQNKRKAPLKPTLTQKLLEIRKSVKELTKDTEGEEFSYVSNQAVLGSVRDKMDDLGVLLVPSIEETVAAAATPNGEQSVKGRMVFTWVDAENPLDKLPVNWVAYGSNNDISRAMGTMTTYAKKDFIIEFFFIPQKGMDADEKGNQTKNQNSLLKDQNDYIAKQNEEIQQLKNKLEEKCQCATKEVVPTVNVSPDANGQPCDSDGSCPGSHPLQPMNIWETNRDLREQSGQSPDPLSMVDLDWIDTICEGFEEPEIWDNGINVIISDKRHVDGSESDRRAIQDYYITLRNDFATQWNEKLQQGTGK